MNISVVLLSSPTVLLRRYVTNIMIKAMRKPMSTTTTYPTAWGRGGSMVPLAAARENIEVIVEYAALTLRG